MRTLRALLQNERGATALEYGFILALVTLIVVVGVRGVADVTVGMWNTVATKVNNG